MMDFDPKAVNTVFGLIGEIALLTAEPTKLDFESREKFGEFLYAVLLRVGDYAEDEGGLTFLDIVDSEEHSKEFSKIVSEEYLSISKGAK